MRLVPSPAPAGVQAAVVPPTRPAGPRAAPSPARVPPPQVEPRPAAPDELLLRLLPPVVLVQEHGEDLQAVRRGGERCGSIQRHVARARQGDGEREAGGGGGRAIPSEMHPTMNPAAHVMTWAGGWGRAASEEWPRGGKRDANAGGPRVSAGEGARTERQSALRGISSRGVTSTVSMKPAGGGPGSASLR